MLLKSEGVKGIFLKALDLFFIYKQQKSNQIQFKLLRMVQKSLNIPNISNTPVISLT